MKDYVGQSLDETNDKIKSIQEDIIDKQNNAFLYNVKSFEQRVFTTLIAFGMIYLLSLIITPILSALGLYMASLSRILCMNASIVGTIVYYVCNVVRYNDSEKIKDYFNKNKRHNRLIEEYNQNLDIAKLNTNLTIEQMTYNNLIVEDKILFSLKDKYNVDDKTIDYNELENNYNMLEKQKDELKRKIDIGIKKFLLLGRFENFFKNYKKNSYAIKYGFISLVISLVVWNLPLVLTGLFVELPTTSLLSLFLTSFLPPAIVSVAFAGFGQKRENDDLYLFNEINKSLGTEALDFNVNEEEKKEFTTSFDSMINEYVELNTKSTLLKSQIDDRVNEEIINDDELSLDEKRDLVNKVFEQDYSSEKEYLLSLKKKDNRK